MWLSHSKIQLLKNKLRKSTVGFCYRKIFWENYKMIEIEPIINEILNKDSNNIIRELFQDDWYIFFLGK